MRTQKEYAAAPCAQLPQKKPKMPRKAVQRGSLPGCSSVHHVGVPKASLDALINTVFGCLASCGRQVDAAQPRDLASRSGASLDLRTLIDETPLNRCMILERFGLSFSR